MESTIDNNPLSTNSEHQVLQEPVPTLPQKASTKVITQAIGEALPDAGVDTVVRLYAKTKLDGWEKRGIHDPQTRGTWFAQVDSTIEEAINVLIAGWRRARHRNV